MAQLVTAADVKKAYRKACLAVHPDKVKIKLNYFILNLSFLIFFSTAHGHRKRKHRQNDFHGIE
ncbi:hypothetical protein EGO58_12875 [Limosilactobacillus reuteri]|nr:hypothetical protein EGO58_12875 [Limosilactobacillus reuteri]